MGRIHAASRWALVALMLGAGSLHFVLPDAYAATVPGWLGDPLPLVYVSGVVEVVGGVLLALPATRHAGAWLIAVTLVAVFPANVQMALDGGLPGAGFPLGSPVVAWLRLPVQPLLVWWAWTFTRDPRPTAEHPSGVH